MTCMKQEFCIHEKYCQRHIGQNFDSCILFSRNSKPMTNEEWIKSLDTEQLAKRLHDKDVYAFFVCRNGGKVPSVEHYVSWLKEIHE